MLLPTGANCTENNGEEAVKAVLLASEEGFILFFSIFFSDSTLVSLFIPQANYFHSASNSSVFKATKLLVRVLQLNSKQAMQLAQLKTQL